MTRAARAATETRAVAERLRATAEKSRPTFRDETRPGFDQHVIDALRTDLTALASRMDELDTSLERALRLLE